MGIAIPKCYSLCAEPHNPWDDPGTMEAIEQDFLLNQSSSHKEMDHLRHLARRSPLILSDSELDKIVSGPDPLIELLPYVRIELSRAEVYRSFGLGFVPPKKMRIFRSFLRIEPADEAMFDNFLAECWICAKYLLGDRLIFNGLSLIKNRPLKSREQLSKMPWRRGPRVDVLVGDAIYFMDSNKSLRQSNYNRFFRVMLRNQQHNLPLPPPISGAVELSRGQRSYGRGLGAARAHQNQHQNLESSQNQSISLEAEEFLQSLNSPERALLSRQGNHAQLRRRPKILSPKKPLKPLRIDLPLPANTFKQVKKLKRKRQRKHKPQRSVKRRKMQS